LELGRPFGQLLRGRKRTAMPAVGYLAAGNPNSEARLVDKSRATVE
jgi:hypothetical protein